MKTRPWYTNNWITSYENADWLEFNAVPGNINHINGAIIDKTTTGVLIGFAKEQYLEKIISGHNTVQIWNGNLSSINSPFASIVPPL